MGKPSILDNNPRRKGSRITKKALNVIQSNSNEKVDSLSSLKPKENGNIDKKFMLLKSELQSLFLNPKAGISKNLSSNKGEIHETGDHDKFIKHQDSISSSNPKQSKFSEWLSGTIDKMDVKSPGTGISEKLEFNESLPSTAKSGLKSKYNMTLMPRFKVERLLYKSFKLQNLGTYMLSSSDESEAEELSSTKIKKKKTWRSKGNSTTFSTSFPRKNFKRKRAPLDSDVEVINLEDSLKKDRCKKIHYVDLDAETYDWSEPFYEKNTSDCSDLEIIDDNYSDASLNIKKQNSFVKVSVKETSFNTTLQKRNSNKSFTSPGTKKNWECPICFERSQGQSIVATICGHIFCKVCLEKHNSAHGLHCPTCRFDLRDKNPIVLYNL